VNDHAGEPTTIYAEKLDLSRFTGRIYEEAIQKNLEAKYAGKPIGVVVAIGSATLEYVMGHRAALWPNVPVVFAMADEAYRRAAQPSRRCDGQGRSS
jgi:hypothetical protein